MNGLYGRRRIETSESVIDTTNLLHVLSKTEAIFEFNRAQVRYLHNYYLGKQPILDRTKDVRPEINNTPVENHASEIVNFFTGYLFGNPCVYVRSGASSDEDGVSEDIAKLNNAMQYEGKESSDRILGQWMLESGVAYRIIVPDKSYFSDEDESPFLIDNIDSDMAYVIRNSGVGHKVMAGVMHIARDNKPELIVVYTENMYFEVDNNEIVKAERHALGNVPIIEYELNPERMGVFESVIPLLDEMNNMAANRYDAVEMHVQSFMKFINCEIDEEKFEALKKKGAIAIKSTSNMPADVDIVAIELDQSQSQVLVDHTLDQICSISGMPNTGGGAEKSTSDNVGAVIVRNGWNETESRAQQVEQLIRRSDRTFLRIAVKLLNELAGLNLRVSDVDIRFPRRQYENLQSKAQVFCELLNQSIDPEIAFKYSGIFADPQSEFEGSKKYLEHAGRYGDLEAYDAKTTQNTQRVQTALERNDPFVPNETH